MAVYDGVPSIRLEGDEERALALIPEAKALLYKVQTFLKRAEVNTFAMTRRVSDDAYIYALSAHGQNLIHISVLPGEVDVVEEADKEWPETVFPDFYSGLVFNGIQDTVVSTDGEGEEVRTEWLRSFAPTPGAASFFEELQPGRQSVRRLAVRAPQEFVELREFPGSPRIFTQYVRLRASMYSGTMRRAMQIILGLGRIGARKMRDPRKQEPDSRYIKDVEAHGVRVQYDYKWARTHGIHIATDGRPWLIEISVTRGVLAMPLPVFVRSNTPAFKLKAEARDDNAMVYALEDLGWLPTGESFPKDSEELANNIAAGNILRLITPEEMEPFYGEHAPYSSACGWAFNTRGNEAHNTGYRFGEDGFQRGVWYQINIRIGDTKLERDPGEPLAEASAALRKQREGAIYCPPAAGNSPARYIPFKIFEPFMPDPGLLSHEGVPSIISAGKPIPKCDTPVFVCFVNDELKVVSFYRNNNVDGDASEDSYDPRYPGECMYASDWDILDVRGNKRIPPMMYTNDFDHRKVIHAYKKQTHIQSVDLGYDPPGFGDEIFFPAWSFVHRSRIFRRTTQEWLIQNEMAVSAVCVPEYSREAYYYATAEWADDNISYRKWVNYDSLTDPNRAWAWRCYPSLAPGFVPPDCDTRLCRGDAPCEPGRPGRDYHQDRRIVCTWYDNSHPCKDFADAGPWANLCEPIDNWNQPGMDKTESYEEQEYEDSGRCFAAFVTQGHNGPIGLNTTLHEVNQHWMAVSPSPGSIVQHIFAVNSTVGDDAIVYDTAPSTNPIREKRVHGYVCDPVTPNDGYPAFVGVNIP